MNDHRITPFAPMRNENRKYCLPLANSKPDRYCPTCSAQMENVFRKPAKCKNPLCQTVWNLELPSLPVGYTYCKGCRSGVTKNDANFCTLCGRATEIGQKYIHSLQDLKRKKAILEEEFEKEIKKLKTGPVSEPADDFMDDDLLENIPASQLIIDGNDSDKDDYDTKVSKSEERMIME